jgi:hypothetical protein
MSLTIERRILDVAEATQALYRDWSDDGTDATGRQVIGHASELLALLVGHEIRATTTRPPRTGIAVRRAELSRQLEALLPEHPDDEP